MADNAFLIDSTICCGCRSCQTACKAWHGLPAEKTMTAASPEYTLPAKLSAMTWTHVRFYPPVEKKDGSLAWIFFPRMCNHCRDANCVRVCPEHAASYMDGWVVINQDKCIGCGACTEVCVYHVPHRSDVHYINPEGFRILRKDRAHKCTACRTFKLEVPACVDACPTEALLFGNRLSLLEEAERRLSRIRENNPKASLYGTEQFRGLGVLTILPDKGDVFSMPVNPQVLDHAQSDSINSTYVLLSSLLPGIHFMKKLTYRFSRFIGADREKDVS